MDNVWLGIMKKDNDSENLEWMDGSKVKYTNWVTDSKHDENHQCVQMTAGRDSDPMGKWLWANCKKRNNVVCEMILPVTLDTLISWFTSHKADLERILDASEEKINDLETRLQKVIEDRENDAELMDKIRENGGPSSKMEIPGNFVYVQLPGQCSPEEIWPETEWDDISYQYAGLFFRVVEENSTYFDENIEQNASTVRLAEVQTKEYGVNTHLEHVDIPENGNWSLYLVGGRDTGRHTRYRLSKDEIRPRNKAVKIWRRKQGEEEIVEEDNEIESWLSP